MDGQEPKNLIIPKNNAMEVKPGESLQVLNVTVAPAPMQYLNMGVPEEFARKAQLEIRRGAVEAVVWNEKSITLMGNDRTRLVAYVPEWSPDARMFFRQKDHREKNEWGVPTGAMYWDGDFEPVKFTRPDFINFIKRHVPEERQKDVSTLIEEVRRLKIVEARSEEIVSGDDRGHEETMVINRINKTNIPDEFTLPIEITPDYVADFEFECAVDKDGYGKPIIVVRCVNIREKIQAMMRDILAQLPRDVETYYAALQIGDGKK